MSSIIIGLSVTATILFALVVLTKLGVPVIFSVLLALAAGYVWWRFEREDHDQHSWADRITALMDIKDILKYVNKLF